jgi:hypothetical protein
VRGRTPPRGLRPRQRCALRAGGQWRTTPVNLLTYRAERYLVAPRGVTPWVRNMALQAGRRRESIRVVELGEAEKPEVLRAYLRRWRFEVGVFFPGVGANASEAELRRIAPAYPVFRIVPPPAPGGDDRHGLAAAAAADSNSQ